MRCSQGVLVLLSCGYFAACGPVDFEDPWQGHVKIRHPDRAELAAKQVVPDEFLVSTTGSDADLFAYGEALFLAKIGDNERVYRVKLAKEMATDSLEAWEDDPDILHAGPNGVGEAQTSDLGFGSLSLTYTNSMEDAYWINKIKLADAFQFLNFVKRPLGQRPIVAVLDSGLDVEHPALAGQVVSLPLLAIGCPGGEQGCDVTKKDGGIFGRGSVWPVGTAGFDRTCQQDLTKVCPHGTHVAGIIAANPQNGYGGICPDCLILPVKVVEESGDFNGSIIDSSLITGLNYIRSLKEQGLDIRIVNASFGKFRRSRTVSLLIKEVAGSRSGTLFVAAAGNENSQKPQYPGALDEVLSVANIDSINGDRHPTSNFGSWVDIAAPGSGLCNNGFSSGLLSSVPGGYEACAAGTSFSAPVVAGVAGLILSVEPRLTISGLKERLLSTADAEFYARPSNQIYRGQLGSGIVDAAAAVRGTSSASVPATDDRQIEPGCGMIGMASAGTNLLLLSPIAVLFWMRRRHSA